MEMNCIGKKFVCELDVNYNDLMGFLSPPRLQESSRQSLLAPSQETLWGRRFSISGDQSRAQCKFRREHLDPIKLFDPSSLRLSTWVQLQNCRSSPPLLNGIKHIIFGPQIRLVVFLKDQFLCFFTFPKVGRELPFCWVATGNSSLGRDG